MNNLLTKFIIGIICLNIVISIVLAITGKIPSYPNFDAIGTNILALIGWLTVLGYENK